MDKDFSKITPVKAALAWVRDGVRSNHHMSAIHEALNVNPDAPTCERMRKLDIAAHDVLSGFVTERAEDARNAEALAWLVDNEAGLTCALASSTKPSQITLERVVAVRLKPWGAKKERIFPYARSVAEAVEAAIKTLEKETPEFRTKQLGAIEADAKEHIQRRRQS